MEGLGSILLLPEKGRRSIYKPPSAPDSAAEETVEAMVLVETLEEEVQEYLVATPIQQGSRWKRISHHGSRVAGDEEFVDPLLILSYVAEKS